MVDYVNIHTLFHPWLEDERQIWYEWDTAEKWKSSCLQIILLNSLIVLIIHHLVLSHNNDSWKRNKANNFEDSWLIYCIDSKLRLVLYFWTTLKGITGGVDLDAGRTQNVNSSNKFDETKWFFLTKSIVKTIIIKAIQYWHFCMSNENNW